MNNSILDPSILGDIDLNRVKKALDFIMSSNVLTEAQKATVLQEPWRVNYRIKPPTPEEFLSYKYLGPMADSIYPRVRKWFIEFFNGKDYRHAVLYPFIGAGKSTLSVLINLYITTHLCLMRNPKKFIGVASHMNLAFVLCSYNLTKSAEILLEPMINLLEGSEFFDKVRTKEDMIKKERTYQKEDRVDKIYWTTASRNGIYAIQFSNGINYKLASAPKDLLGLTIVCGTMTELSFFREAGKSDEFIMRFFNDMKGRIYSRMKSKTDPTGINYWGRSILDSSPNDLESPIDQYASFEAEKSSLNYVIKGSQWDWVPEDYTEEELADRFPIFKGGSGKPPVILQSPEGYDPTDILWVPRKLYQIFHDDLIKSLKDYGGIPQGNLDRLFYDFEKIENCFIPQLKFLYFPLKADSKMSPFGLIWNQVKDTFFVKSGNGYRFYYKPSIPRVFHIDQSVSGDMTAIAFVHVERKEPVVGRLFDANRDLVYVVDMVVPIHPMGGRINLDAVKEFIIDIQTMSGIPIIQGSYDTFQSEAAIQYLERNGLEMEHVSVDETMDPYLFLAQLIEQGNLKVGKDIFFKNNLKSLRITKTKIAKKPKIDHSSGDTINPQGADYTWETSLLGVNAKDISDAIAGAVYNAKMFLANDGRCLSQVFHQDEIISTPLKIQEKVQVSLRDMGFILPN